MAVPPAHIPFNINLNRYRRLGLSKSNTGMRMGLRGGHAQHQRVVPTAH